MLPFRANVNNSVSSVWYFVEVKIVKNMPMQMGVGGKKPSVAIITSKYYEKLTVDAMMEKKTTFVRYKTEGRLATPPGVNKHSLYTHVMLSTS